MPSATIRALLKTQRAQLFGLCELRGVKRLGPIYEKSRAELEEKLAALVRAGRGKSFTAFHIRQVLAQVYDVVSNFQDELGLHLTKQQSVATALAQRHVIKSATTLERFFTGHAPVLQVESAAVLRGIDHRVVPSLLDRYRRSARLYGPPVVKAIKDQLALSMIQSEPLDAAVDRVAGTDGIFAGQRWRAERIARTELSYGFHAVANESMREIHRTDMPDMKRTLVSTFDDRTGKDSFEQHMQVRGMDEPFEYHVLDSKGHRTGKIIRYDFPPNRPHDRSTLLPWRDGWPKMAVGDPGAVEPRSPPSGLTP